MPADRGTQIIEVPDYEGLLAKYETLQRERDDIHKNLVAVRVAIGDMEKDRDKYKARIRVLEEEAKELQQELGCWESATGCGSHDKGADLIAALRRERTQLDNQLASARARVEKAEASLGEMENQRNRARSARNFIAAALERRTGLVPLWWLHSVASHGDACERAVSDGPLFDEDGKIIVEAGQVFTVERSAARGQVKVCDESGGGSIGFVVANQLARKVSDASKSCADCDLTMPLDFAKVCDACKNSLPHALWLLFTAAPMDERRLAGEAIWHILTARNRQNDDRTELRSEIEHLQRVSKAAHERAEKAEGAVDDMGNQIALVRDWWYRRSRAWKRSARGFRTKAKMFHGALLLAHKERDEVRAKLAAFGQADTQPQIAGFVVETGEAVRLENGVAVPADPQAEIAKLKAAAQGDREMRKELGDIMGGVSPKNPDKIPSWPLLHNTARGLRRLADQAGEGNSQLWKMVAAAVGDEWKKYHTAGTSMASALCATITGIRQRLAGYEQPFNNLTLLEIEERRAEDADCKALINAIRIERGNVDALKETLQRIARILNFGTAGKADSLVECVGRVHAAWLQARKDLAEHRSNVDTWAYAQLIGRKNAEKRAARAEQKRDAAITRLRETDLLRRESIAEAQSLRARLAELTPQPPKEP